MGKSTTLALKGKRFRVRFFCAITLLAAFLSLGAAVDACENLPQEQLWSTQELINNTRNIVLAQAYKPQNVSGEIYITEFFVTELLKGDQLSNFSLTGKLAFEKLGRNTFNNHNDIQFLVYSDTGNFSRDENCNIYGHFEEGRKYLLFVDQPKHPRSFEVIESPSDAWLLEIKKLINQ